MTRLPNFLMFLFLSVSALFVQTATAQEAPSCHSKQAQQTQPHMGVYLATVEGENATGVKVEDIGSDSPAMKAGLQAGDVITQLNGVAVNTPMALKEQVAQLKPGDKVSVDYLRNGQKANTSLVLGAKPMIMQDKKMTWVNKMTDEDAPNPDRGFMGVILNVNKEEIAENGKTTSTSTVTVEEVVKESGAEKAGLLAGDIILLVNGVDINGNADMLYQTLDNSKAGDVVRITYLRNGEKANASVKLGKQPEGMQHRMMKMETENFGGGAKKTCEGMGKSAACCAGEKNSKKAFLGVVGETVTADVAKEYAIKNIEGVYISEVVKGSAAEEAGLQAGDVLTYINKEDIETMEELSKVMGTYIPGDKVKVKYVRNGKTQKTNAVLKTNAKSASCCAGGEKKSCGEKKQGSWTDDKGNVEKIIIMDGDDANLPEKFKVFIERAENGEGVNVKVVKVFITEPNAEEVKMLEKVMAQDANGGNAKTITTEPDALNINDLSFYPNPNQGKFTLNFSVKEGLPTLVRIADISGREVYREDLGNFSGTYSKQLDISENTEGIYLLQIMQGDKMLVKKLLLQQ